MRLLHFATLAAGFGLTLGVPVAAAAPAWQEGVPAVFGTGDGAGRVSQSLVFSAETVGSGPARVRFEIGFSTAESVLDPAFLDSFTLSATGGPGRDSAVLLTLDGFGAAALPGSPGALLLPASTLQLTPTTPALGFFTDPAARFTAAFSGVWDLPTQFQNRELTVFADLFDNGNGVASRGYVVVVHPQLVPEPAVWVLCGCGLGLVWLGRRNR